MPPVSHAVLQAVTLARDPHAAREPRLDVFDPVLVIRDSTAPPATSS